MTKLKRLGNPALDSSGAYLEQLEPVLEAGGRPEKHATVAAQQKTHSTVGLAVDPLYPLHLRQLHLQYKSLIKQLHLHTRTPGL